MATLTDLTQEVLDHQFAPTQYTTYIEGKINQAQNYISAQLDFDNLLSKSTFSTSPSTTVYSLPSDFQRLYNIYVTDATGSIQPLIAQVINEFDVNPKSSGQPIKYTIESNNLRLYPVPDNTYSVTVRYFRWPDELVNANDASEIPDQYNHLFVSYALRFCYERENDYQAADYHRARFEEGLAKARGELQYNTDDYTQPKRVGDNRVDPLSPNVWTV